MKLELTLLSTLMVIGSARLTLKPSPRRDITFPRHVVQVTTTTASPNEPEPEVTMYREGEANESSTEEESTAPTPESDRTSAAKLRVTGTRRKKVKQVSATRKNETTRETNISSGGSTERKQHTKIVHVQEPYVVHVEKPYPVYIEKPVIVEKHIPIKLYITKKEFKHR